MDNYLKEFGLNTRVVVFFYDKGEFKEEIKFLRHFATKLANRYNLRIGIVNGRDLVTSIFEKHEDFYVINSSSVMVLKRYDGEIFKTNLSELQPKEYAEWISDKSSKPIDVMSPALLQLAASAEFTSFCMIFVDFKEPKVARKSTALIKLMTEIKPMFDKHFKFV